MNFVVQDVAEHAMSPALARDTVQTLVATKIKFFVLALPV
jgi:hypothetical protein